MRLRPYIHARDYDCIKEWANDEKVFSLWCADLIPRPMTEAGFRDFLDKEAEERGGSAYVATEDNGNPIGFFVYSVNTSDNSGFLKFVLLDNKMRGNGYGTQMLKLLLKYAFEITGVSFVQLNVFDINDNAKKCYANVGFVEDNIEAGVFEYKNERWGRCHMVVSR